MDVTLAEAKQCPVCKRVLPFSEFYYHHHSFSFFRSCKGCHKAHVVECLGREGCRVRLWRYSVGSARARGFRCCIKPMDIPLPKTCKYLGVDLDYEHWGKHLGSRKWDSPSIDRIDSSKGYVPGNIQVISELANRMKQDATVEQLLAFAAGVFRVHGPREDKTLFD